MKKFLTRWTCDACPKTRLTDGHGIVEDLPDRWTLVDGLLLCGSCQKPWYDDLCVEVTLANMKRKNTLVCTVGDAVVIACGVEFHSYRRECYNWPVGRPLDRFALETETGIAKRVNPASQDIERSPHSIVRLIPPTFTDSCRYPRETINMAIAAHKTHDALSDLKEWKERIDFLHIIVAAFSDVPAADLELIASK